MHDLSPNALEQVGQSGENGAERERPWSVEAAADTTAMVAGSQLLHAAHRRGQHVNHV
jgi:hypothetical protein